MNITVIHGQKHKGVSYTITQAILQKLQRDGDELREFSLPIPGLDFCRGCYSCFVRGEEFCPSSEKVQPIADALDWADIILIDTPNYVLEMSGALKNLMDHLAYRWVAHRPRGSMFRKVGITICSSAGAPAGGITKSVARQLKWMCVPKVYRLPLTSGVMTVSDLSAKKKAEIDRKATKIARAARNRTQKPRAGIKTKFFFLMMRKMQMSPDAAWNPTDRDWWIQEGWTGKKRPWKAQ